MVAIKYSDIYLISTNFRLSRQKRWWKSHHASLAARRYLQVQDEEMRSTLKPNKISILYI